MEKGSSSAAKAGMGVYMDSTSKSKDVCTREPMSGGVVPGEDGLFLLMVLDRQAPIVEDVNGVFVEASGGTCMEKPSVFVTQPAVSDGVSLTPVEGLGL
jgi:hypothetical protein